MVRGRKLQHSLRLALPPLAPASEDIHELSSLLMSPPVIWPGSPGTVESLADLEKLSVLGRGSSGTVYKVRHIRTASILAVKVLRLGSGAIVACQEAEIMKRVDSPFVVRCRGVFDSGGDLCFVMEYMEAGSLHDVLRARRKLPEEVISGVARRVLEGLKYLHGMGIVHRDIKPSNLLINGQGEVKIADFGVSQVVAGSIDTCDSCVGTCAYMSPERFDSEGFGGGGDNNGFSGDVWALGVALLECHVGHFPLVSVGERPDWITLMCGICFGELPDVVEAASPEFCGFVSRCLEKDWKRRGTVPELLNHPFVAKCCSSESLIIGC